ncbi:MAG TPA: MarR family transcriptional regulator [Opitutaceae bacterium]|nr:MarR family transcriptional regulator [Opitutaceae bacterium]
MPPLPAPELRAKAEFDRECIEFFGEVVQLFSIPRSLGQIFGLLFASDEPLSFTDIVDQLGISKGSVSQGLRLLRSLGAVQVVAVGADHREMYGPELALRKLLGGVIQGKIEPFLRSGETRVRRMRELAETAPAGPRAKFTRQRVRQLNTWRRQLGLLLPLLKVLLGPGQAEAR